MKNYSTQYKECRANNILKEIECKGRGHKILLCTLFKEVCSSKVCKDIREKLSENDSILQYIIDKK